MKKNRITALILGIVMLISASGCSSAAKETGAATEQTPSATSENVAESETSEAAAEVVTEPLTDFLAGHETFELTSEDLKDGVWEDAISFAKGESVSPQLSWAPVDGAYSYVIVMVDTTARFIVHWKNDAVTETDLPRGWAPSSEYVGPNPPSGSTNVYEVYVVVLRAPAEKVSFVFSGTNPKIETAFKALDTDSEGNEGNIIAYGHIAGKFTN